ncbi:hypothetical protein [Undibacterium parvum]|uniref:Uncharacterized protein n=1 Tax=Undibacterium parvum TaxID=401471 RepID=A0A3Q9BR00_9BURK|nr:hypothetical protein [Undibacterium parvum]AZP12528.1 hypothetical protein EJN92_11240 [Undibacterium parvum]
MQKILVNFVFIFFNILALPSKASEQVTCEMLERKILNKITEDGGYLIVNGISILDRETRDIWLYGMPENVFSEPPHDKVIDLGLLPNGMHQKIFINCAKNNAIVLLQGGVVDQYVWFGPIAYQTFQTKIN